VTQNVHLYRGYHRQKLTEARLPYDSLKLLAASGNRKNSSMDNMFKEYENYLTIRQNNVP
jgi:hypothetical protein